MEQPIAIAIPIANIFDYSSIIRTEDPKPETRNPKPGTRLVDTYSARCLYFAVMNSDNAVFHGTTILLVRKGNQIVIAGDGQVTLGDTVIKKSARKIRRVYNDRVLVGFAGATADAFALFSRLEMKLEQFQGNLNRAAVELAQEWRTDRALRHLEAYLLATDGKSIYMISGTGDVIEPDDGVLAVGSGGVYALAAARALLRHTKMPAGKIAQEALKIASEICVFTNSEITIEEL
jgi:ATP-dependent HslUV protease, peptidase subunit HslV